jgi:hypothetical protein
VSGALLSRDVRTTVPAIMMLRWQIFTSQETHAAVQVLAKQLGISPGELVRRAIDRELARAGEFRQVPPMPERRDGSVQGRGVVA